MKHLLAAIELLEQKKIDFHINHVKVYKKSYVYHDNVHLIMIKERATKGILAVGNGQVFDDLDGTNIGEKGKFCLLTHHNRLVLNRYFDYTVPKAFGTKEATMGLGDRLGLASPGHIETIRGSSAKPILAQQSIRELTLTNRTMNDMLDAACFAVFQEGYKDGFGADGDHIKEEKDIKQALSLGISMLTLDCSDKIPKGVEKKSIQQLSEEYEKLPRIIKKRYKDLYLNRTFELNGVTISFDEKSLMQNVLQYSEALNYMIHVYKEYIKKEMRKIDFEISIDETETITSPIAHFFVANELRLNGVEVTSLAPRFCGEFQKGIDYIGDIEQFEYELSEHALIADHFGYKLSIHSGSDKFKVFPIIAKYTKGILHVKTAGTNWLEAIRVIAQTNPNLYRQMHVFALEHFEEALAYYHVTPDLAGISPLENVPDSELDSYMDDDAARQLFHVTYGLLLTAEDENGNHIFKDEFFQTLNAQEEQYQAALVKHIGKHINLLGLQ